MLKAEDFNPINWESVTWRIVAGSYVAGHAMSACLPPASYLDWVINQFQLFHPGAILIENAVDLEGMPVWKLTIRQAEDGTVLQERLG